MRNIFIKMSKTKLLSYSLFAFSIFMLLFTFYGLASVKVLADWKLSMPEGIVHSGDQLVLISQYTKLRDVNGKASRYIECRTKTSHVFVRYQLNEAVANRAKGAAGTGIPIVVPRNIPDLPATCRFSLAIIYDVLPFKKDYETNSTKEFTLYPAVQPPNPAIMAPKL